MNDFLKMKTVLSQWICIIITLSVFYFQWKIMAEFKVVNDNYQLVNLRFNESWIWNIKSYSIEPLDGLWLFIFVSIRHSNLMFLSTGKVSLKRSGMSPCILLYGIYSVYIIWTIWMNERRTYYVNWDITKHEPAISVLVHPVSNRSQNGDLYNEQYLIMTVLNL